MLNVTPWLIGGMILSHHLAPEPLIVAHRGASYDAPENTLAAFRLAWEQGANAIEGDFYLSSDGEIVCIHDATTTRTSGVNRRVAETPFAELRKLDVGQWKNARFTGERIPTLAEVLTVVPEGKQIFVEVKCGPEIVTPMKRVIEASKLKPEQVIVIAFDSQVIAESKKQMPNIKAYWLTSYRKTESGTLTPTIDEVLKTLRDINADGLDSNAHSSIDQAFVDALREAGMEFHIWTVDEPAVARRFIEMGVDSITTNRPAWLRERLQQPKN